MRKLLNSLPAKIGAILLSYVMVVVLLISLVSVICMGYFNFYFSSQSVLEENLLSDMALSESYNLEIYHDLGRDIEYNYKNKNVYYLIETADGETVETNYSGQDILLAEQNYGEKFIYTIYLKAKMNEVDKFSVARQFISLGYKLRYAMILFAVLSLILEIVLLCFLYCSAGHKFAYSNIHPNYLDQIPFDIYTAFVFGVVAFGIYVLFNVFFEDLESTIYLFVFGTVAYFLLLGYTMSFATRIKMRNVLKNTIIYKVLFVVLRGLKKLSKFTLHYLKRLPLVWQVVLELAVILFFETIFFMFNLHQVENLTLGFIALNFLFVVAVLYVAITLTTIKKGGEKIASGDLEYKIDTKYMILDFKDFSEKLNSINDGLQLALNEKMKSERFKTELITNVSHDIKTPLTSIVNYVDLLKKEEIENQKANEYISVLYRQSEKLKKLVEDLVEASKASTGNLQVNLEDCNVNVLLSQVLGEFDERLKKSGINAVLQMPKENVIIKADARHLWRVFDNLFINICKYSQSDTRAYISTEAVGENVRIIFKNISRYPLNISGEELMERFVRGDTSRNTEGSGLGLSIARGLTELQNGSMKIDIDGDLFKVTLEFPKR